MQFIYCVPACCLMMMSRVLTQVITTDNYHSLVVSQSIRRNMYYDRISTLFSCYKERKVYPALPLSGRSEGWVFEAVSLAGGVAVRQCLVSRGGSLAPSLPLRQVVTALTAGTTGVEGGELLGGVGSLQRPIPPVLSLTQ